MKHILFFGHRPFPTDHAVLETVFTRHLPTMGYRPVWVLKPTYPDAGDRREVWNDTPVFVIRKRRWRGLPQLLELFRQYLAYGRMALAAYPIDIIQARTGLPEALVAWWLAKRHHKPFVFQYSFPVALNRRDKLRQTKWHWLAGPLYHLEIALLRFLMRQAGLTLAISETMRDIWQARGVQRIVAFPLGADTGQDPMAVQPIEAPPDTVVYVGSMDPARRLDFLLEAFARVHQAMPTAHLLMVGDAAGSGLEACARELGIRDAVTFTGPVPHAEVGRYIRAARCSAAPIPPGPKYNLSSPTKVVESLGWGIPVVANREIHDQRQIIEQSGGGFAVPYDVAAFAEAILKLLRDPEEAARRGAAGRAYIVQERDYRVLSRRLTEHYDRLLAREGA